MLTQLYTFGLCIFTFECLYDLCYVNVWSFQSGSACESRRPRQSNAIPHGGNQRCTARLPTEVSSSCKILMLGLHCLFSDDSVM